MSMKKPLSLGLYPPPFPCPGGQAREVSHETARHRATSSDVRLACDRNRPCRSPGSARWCRQHADASQQAHAPRSAHAPASAPRHGRRPGPQRGEAQIDGRAALPVLGSTANAGQTSQTGPAGSAQQSRAPSHGQGRRLRDRSRICERRTSCVRSRCHNGPASRA